MNYRRGAGWAALLAGDQVSMGYHGCNRGNDCFKKLPYTICIRGHFISTAVL